MLAKSGILTLQLLDKAANSEDLRLKRKKKQLDFRPSEMAVTQKSSASCVSCVTVIPKPEVWDPKQKPCMVVSSFDPLAT